VTGLLGPTWSGRTPLGLAVAVLSAGLLAGLTAVLAVPQQIAGSAAPTPVRMAMDIGAAGSAADTTAADCGPGWGTGWMTAPQAAPADPAISGATLRMIVHPQLSGSEVRIRLSNAYGDGPLEIGAASVARAEEGAAVVPGTLRPVTFDGRPRTTVAAGRDVLSDPVPLAVGAGRVLAISVHLSSTPRVATVHPVALQTSYLSDRGDFTRTPDAGPFDHRISSWPVLTALDVLQPHPTNAVVAIGDSITDGFGSKVNADQRWTDALERRLAAEGGSTSMAVLNAGLSANQLLVDDPQRGGTSPAARFERDVAAAAGVTDVVLHIGTNDIAAGRSAAEITAGLQRFAELARGAGLRVFLSTITPSRTEAHGTRTAVATRNAVNDWIRGHGREHADGVLDFAKAVADRTEPTRLAAAYDSGDGLHLSAAGYRALAAAVDIDALTGSPCRAADAPAAVLLVAGR
jgi:lysophospholipase L1-like esterase